MFRDPDLKFFPANTAPLSLPDSPSEQHEPFPAPLYISNVLDPPQSTLQEQILGVTTISVDPSHFIANRFLSSSLSILPVPPLETSNYTIPPHSPPSSSGSTSIQRPLGLTQEDCKLASVLLDTSVPASPSLSPTAQRNLPEVMLREFLSTPVPSTANLLPAPFALLSARPDHSITSPSSRLLSEPVCQLSKSGEPEFPLASNSLQKPSEKPAEPPSSVHSPPPPPRSQLEVRQINSVFVPLEATLVPTPPTASSIPLEDMPADSISTTFEITPAPISPAVQSSQLQTTQQLLFPTPRGLEFQEPVPVCKVLATLSVIAVTNAAVIVSTYLNDSKTLPTRAHKRWSKNEGFN